MRKGENFVEKSVIEKMVGDKSGGGSFGNKNEMVQHLISKQKNPDGAVIHDIEIEKITLDFISPDSAKKFDGIKTPEAKELASYMEGRVEAEEVGRISQVAREEGYVDPNSKEEIKAARKRLDELYGNKGEDLSKKNKKRQEGVEVE